jgi:hypothetical protein
MWWKLGLLFSITILILYALFAPMQTVSIRVDLPAAPQGTQQISATQVQGVAQGIMWGIETALVVGVLAVAAFVGWRIVRHHKRAA